MFKYEGSNLKIKKAVDIANDKKLINFVITMIKEAQYYDMSNMQPTKLAAEAEHMLNNNQMKVELYYPKWKYSKALGYFSASNPDIVNVNGYKVNSLDEIELISMLYHEYCHYIDSNLPLDYYANHGSNSPIGKDYTFQYSVNRYVYEYFNYEREKPKVRLLWYKRLLNFIWRA